MDSFNEYFKRRSAILKSLTPIIQKTGVPLIAAKNVKSRQVRPDDLERFFENPYSKRKPRTLDFDELQSRSESYDHRSILDCAIDHYLILGYKVYQGGVGVAGLYTFADFVAEQNRHLVFGESLTSVSLKKAGTLQRKLQLAQYGKLCFIVPSSAIQLHSITEDLQQISRKHAVLVYSDIGLGLRENHIIDLDAYLFFSKSATNLPRLTAQIERKASLVKIAIQFSKIPASIKEIELKETWRKAFSHHRMSKKDSFKVPAGTTISNNGYLLNFLPRMSKGSHSNKRDLLSVRILGRIVEISTRTKLGQAVFRDRFGALFKRRGIDQVIKTFISQASTDSSYG